MTEYNQEAKEWKHIDGYGGKYEVSSTGDIRTIRRQGTNARILKQHVDKNGYRLIALCKDGKYKTHLVHRLVANAFINNPNDYPCVNHKDEDKSNNCVENLEWCTYSYNNTYGTIKERASQKRYKPCIGTWPDGHKESFNSCTLASKATGIAQGNIWGACNGLWRKAGGVIWQYVGSER